MRKWYLGALFTLALLLVCMPAMAQTFVYDSIFASAEVPETYIILTPDNLASYSEWLAARNTTSEDLTNDMLARGVLMQCWTSEGDACVELTATQTEQTQNLFDINEQNSSIRAQYRLSHYPENQFEEQGYEFSSVPENKEFRNQLEERALDNSKELYEELRKKEGFETINKETIRLNNESRCYVVIIF